MFAVTFFVCPAMFLCIYMLATYNYAGPNGWNLRGVPSEQNREKAIGCYAEKSCSKKSWLIERNAIWVEPDHKAG